MSKPKKRGRLPKAGSSSATGQSTDPEQLLNQHSRLLNQSAKAAVESEVRSKECVFESTSQADSSWFDQLFALSTDTFDSMPPCFDERLIIGNEIKPSKPQTRTANQSSDIGGSSSDDDESMTKSQSRISGVKRGFSEMSDTSMDGSRGVRRRRHSRSGDSGEDNEIDGDVEMEGFEMPDMADFNEADGSDESQRRQMMMLQKRKKKRKKLKQLPKDFEDKYQADMDMADVIGDGSIIDEANDTHGLADAGGSTQMSSSLLDPLLQSGIDTHYERSYALPRSVGQITSSMNDSKQSIDKGKEEAMSAEDAAVLTHTHDEVAHYLNCPLLERSLERSMKESYGQDWHISKHGMRLCELAFFTQFKNVLRDACVKRKAATAYVSLSHEEGLFAEQSREESSLDWIRKRNEEFDQREAKQSEEVAVDDLASEKANLRFKSLTGSLTMEEERRKEELKHQLSEAQSNFSLAALGGDFSFDFGGGGTSSSSSARAAKKRDKKDLYESARLRREQRLFSISERDVLCAVRSSDSLSRLFPCSRVFES